jgi:hypothetical protein
MGWLSGGASQTCQLLRVSRVLATLSIRHSPNWLVSGIVVAVTSVSTRLVTAPKHKGLSARSTRRVDATVTSKRLHKAA